MRKGIFHIEFKFLCFTHFSVRNCVASTYSAVGVMYEISLFSVFGILDTLSSLLSMMFEGYITLIHLLTIFFLHGDTASKFGVFDTGAVW